MKISPGGDYILIKGKNSFLLLGIADELFTLFIETEKKELCQTVRKGEIIVVSAPEGGDLRHAAMLLELVRTYHQPLVVLKKGHPCSKRLKMVVSAGSKVVMKCDILRGTHPEQDVICSSDELSDIYIESLGDEVIIKSTASGEASEPRETTEPTESIERKVQSDHGKKSDCKIIDCKIISPEDVFTSETII